MPSNTIGWLFLLLLKIFPFHFVAIIFQFLLNLENFQITTMEFFSKNNSSFFMSCYPAFDKFEPIGFLLTSYRRSGIVG